jgi:Leucine-rich repeat (LRR) protein
LIYLNRQINFVENEFFESIIYICSPFRHAVLKDSKFLSKFHQLKFLKLQNVDLKFSEEEALWTKTLERLHVEDSTLSSLPRWFSQCNRLTNLLIKRTKLESLIVISQMSFLALAYLDSNQFEDLNKVSFKSPYIEVIDLSNNQVS